METLELPKEVYEIIDGYKKLNLGGKEVACPYYINIHKAKDLRAMVGKGTPEEIEMEARMWEKLKGVNFDSMSEEEIRQFLIDRGIGIDCSGFIMHVLNEYHLKKFQKPIWGKIKPGNQSFLGKLSYMLKPVQKLGAEIITNKQNSEEIKIKDVKPGDVIRSKGKKKNSHHIILVSSVKKEGKEVKEIEYIQSYEHYGKNNGIREGKIIIKDQNLPLKDQEWVDPDVDGINHTFEGFMVNVEDNGLRRIKATEELF